MYQDVLNEGLYSYWVYVIISNGQRFIRDDLSKGKRIKLFEWKSTVLLWAYTTGKKV